MIERLSTGAKKIILAVGVAAASLAIIFIKLFFFSDYEIEKKPQTESGFVKYGADVERIWSESKQQFSAIKQQTEELFSELGETSATTASSTAGAESPTTNINISEEEIEKIKAELEVRATTTGH